MTDKQKSPTDVVQMAFSLQEMADLRHLLTIAVWIRTEQLHPENVLVAQIRPVQPDDTIVPHVPPGSVLPTVALLNELLVRETAQADFESAQKWWKIFNGRLEVNGLKGLTASWTNEKG